VEVLAKPSSIREWEESDIKHSDSDDDLDTQDIRGDIVDFDPEEIIECLCYKHITLVLLPNPDGDRDVLAMEVDLQFTKGHKRNLKRRVVHERHRGISPTSAGKSSASTRLTISFSIRLYA
jgi:hypothetical protein